MIAELKTIMRFGHLTVRQLAVLLVLHREGREIRLCEVGQVLGLRAPVLSRAYDTLQHLGLIDRRRGEDDRRQMFAIVTDKGRAIARKFD